MSGSSFRSALLIMVGFLAGGCRDENLLYYSNNPAGSTFSRQHPIKEINGNSKVDLLWVIDNSGSMDIHQQSVKDNTRAFMQNFIAAHGLDWRMGLISTSENENPYVGFDPATRLDRRSADPVKMFTDAVSRLGTNGASDEKTFDPVKAALTKHPDFLRPQAALVIISVTDAPEQSSMSVNDFLGVLRGFKRGSSEIYAYGAFAASDFRCDTREGLSYAGSKYEAMIQQTHGKVLVLCDPGFGKALADVGKEVVQRVSRSRIFLETRPRPSTIRVSFNGEDLPGGPQELGGLWYYDYGNNSVVFYNLEFAGEQENADVKVDYQEDTGFDSK